MLGDGATPVDITVYGATGWVAQFILGYLVQVSSAEKRKVKVELVGRNKSKLEKRKDEYKETTNEFIEWSIFVAESSDVDAIRNMVHRTKVVICAAGPFERYANQVVAACSECGTDYVDITGEFYWSGKMRVQHGAAAKKSGARIISLCGFDSIPSDLSIFAAVQALRQSRGPQVQSSIERGTTWHSVRGMPNSGTVTTMAGFPMDWKKMLFDSGSSSRRRIPWMIDSPLILTHPTKVRFNPDFSRREVSMAWNEWMNLIPQFEEFCRYGMSLPFFMAAMNTKVVHASAVALDYGPRFRYRERFFPFGFQMTRLMSFWSAIPTLFIYFLMMIVVIVVMIPLGGPKILSWLFPPGTGVSKKDSVKGYAQVYADVTAPAIAPSQEGNVDRATCFMSFTGDPGNMVTAQVVVEAALSLLWDKKDLPPRSDDGFGTPAELLGDVLLKRLTETKVRPLEMTVKVHKDRPAYSEPIMHMY